MLLRRTSYCLRALLLAAVLAIAACQAAPVQEMSDARQAISVAREAGAEERAADDLDAAVNFLHSAERHLSERRYENARQDAEQAKIKALSALERSASMPDDDR